MSANMDTVNALYDERETTSAQTGIALRSHIAKEIFGKLPADEQETWKLQGDAEWKELCDRVANAEKGEPSADPIAQNK